MIYDSTTLNSNAILKLYLYGRQGVPSNLVDPNLVRGRDATTMIQVDAIDYMANGAGRFANGASFSVVTQFLNGEGALAAGEYGKFALFDLYGLTVPAERGAVVHQAFYADGKDDAHDRVNIFNTTAFQLGDNVTFHVEADGTRWIENFSITPYEGEEPENYDFEGGNFLTNYLNNIDDGYLDPGHLGRKVLIDFVNTPPARSSPYTLADLAADQAVQSGWTLPGYASLASQHNAWISNTYASGITRFLDGDRAIYYTSDLDWIPGRNPDVRPDPNSFTFDEGLQNGITLVGDNEGSYLTGFDTADRMVGGDGGDFIVGNEWWTSEFGFTDQKRDLLQGGQGYDTYVLADSTITHTQLQTLSFDFSIFDDVDEIHDVGGDGAVRLELPVEGAFTLFEWDVFTDIDGVEIDFNTSGDVYNLWSVYAEVYDPVSEQWNQELVDAYNHGVSGVSAILKNGDFHMFTWSGGGTSEYPEFTFNPLGVIKDFSFGELDMVLV